MIFIWNITDQCLSLINMTSAQFSDPITISRLRDKQGYELWLLDFLKENSPFKSRDIEDSVIKPDGTVATNIVLSERFSDNRAHEIINNLSPLIFTTTYKLIDNIFEWILEELELAGIIDSIPWPYKRKIELVHELQYSNSLILPKLFVDEPNLFTIIFSPEELFAFSHASVLVAKLLQGTRINIKVWRDIKSRLDIIQTLHGCPKFSFEKPSVIRFTQYAERNVNIATNANEWIVNVYPAWDFIKTRFPGGQIEDFELRIWGKRGDGSLVSWLIPSELLEGLIFFTISENDFKWDMFMIHANKDELEPPMPKNVLAHNLALENKIQCSNCGNYSVSFLGYNSGREEGYYECKRCSHKFSESIKMIPN